MVKRIGDMRLDGRNPLGYMGVRPYTPPQMLVLNRAPTQNDYQGLSLGTQWLHKKVATADSVQYVLVSVADGIAVWIALNDGGQLPTLLQNAVVLGTGAPGFTNVASLGTTGQILTSGGPGTPPVWAGNGGGGGIGSINTIMIDTVGAGTYTPTVGMLQCTVECIGGGGGGVGYATGHGPSTLSGFPGSGGGGYCKKTYNSVTIGASQPYVVGGPGLEGGVAPIIITGGNTGTNGGDTTFGAGPTLITAGGGDAIEAYQGVSIPIPFGGVATGGDININGQNGQAATSNVNNNIFPGAGGNSALGYGYGGAAATTIYDYGAPVYSPANPGTGYGGGAGATMATGNIVPIHGADGAQGLIIITEYIAA